MNDPAGPVSTVSIRRAPKIGAFIAVGAVLGALVTLVLTSLFPTDPSVGFVALFAYFALYGIPAGVLVGAVVALVLDRRSAKRAKSVDVTHDVVERAVENTGPEQS
ncbi:MAG: potassium transporter Trk [Rhodoglobus sp.]|nr:potassium transporter Trk [Rhodoglobus sp.]